MKIDWGRACAGAVVAEIAQIAAAFGYSYLIHPGQPMSLYQARYPKLCSTRSTTGRRTEALLGRVTGWASAMMPPI